MIRRPAAVRCAAHKVVAEMAAVDASKNLKIPAHTPEPTGPIMDRPTGQGFLPAPEISAPAPSAHAPAPAHARAPASAVMSMPVASSSEPTPAPRAALQQQQSTVSADSLAPRNPNLSMKESSLLEEKKYNDKHICL